MIEVARAIAKGKANSLKQFGLREKNGEILKVRVKSGKPFIPTISAPTPLVYAIVCEHNDIVSTLLDKFHAALNVGVDNVSLKFIATLLHFSNPDEEVRRVCHDLSTALHIAVTQGNVESVMILLKRGADVSTQNQEGNTALHLCCRFNNMDIARALLAAGATVGVANGKGHTPIYIAKHYKNNDLCKLLSGVQKKEIPRGSIDELLRTERYASLQPLFPEIVEKVTPVSAPLDEKKKEEPIAEPVQEQTADEPAEASSEFTQDLLATIQALSERISRLTGTIQDPAEVEELNEASQAVENLMKNVNVAEQEIPQSQAAEEETEEESENEGPFLVPTTSVCEVCGSGVCVSLCQECQHAFCHVCTSSQEHLNLHLGQYF